MLLVASFLYEYSVAIVNICRTISCTGGLKSDVLVVSGQVKGKTVLPLSPQAEMAAHAVCLEEG